MFLSPASLQDVSGAINMGVPGAIVLMQIIQYQYTVSI